MTIVLPQSRSMIETDGYRVEALLDSVSPVGERLTTMEIRFPRFMLAEFNTHRVLSRNSASSRAIPTEKIIEQLTQEPFVPIFNERVKGMGVGVELEPEQQKWARDTWLTARNQMLEAAEMLVGLGVDKSRANRLLEPFMWHTAIVTATEWSNFFALRNNPEAQPEFRQIASMMEEVHKTNNPVRREYNEWHLPLIDWENEPKKYRGEDWDFWKKVSVGRCARVSYLTHDGRRDPLEDVRLCDQLLKNGHMSPFEHVARPTKGWSAQDLPSNFSGWVQYRKEIPNEDDFGKVIACTSQSS